MDLKRIKVKLASSLCLTAMSLSMLSAHSSTPLPAIIVSAEELLQNTQLENLVSTVNVTGNAKIIDSRVPVEVTLSKFMDKESLKNIEEAKRILSSLFYDVFNQKENDTLDYLIETDKERYACSAGYNTKGASCMSVLAIFICVVVLITIII